MSELNFIQKSETDSFDVTHSSPLFLTLIKYLYSHHFLIHHSSLPLLSTHTPHHPTVDSGLSHSISELKDINPEIDSVSSSPGLPRVSIILEHHEHQNTFASDV